MFYSKYHKNHQWELWSTPFISQYLCSYFEPNIAFNERKFPPTGIFFGLPFFPQFKKISTRTISQVLVDRKSMDAGLAKNYSLPWDGSWIFPVEVYFFMHSEAYWPKILSNACKEIFVLKSSHFCNISFPFTWYRCRKNNNQYPRGGENSKSVPVIILPAQMTKFSFAMLPKYKNVSISKQLDFFLETSINFLGECVSLSRKK